MNTFFLEPSIIISSKSIVCIENKLKTMSMDIKFSVLITINNNYQCMFGGMD